MSEVTENERLRSALSLVLDSLESLNATGRYNPLYDLYIYVDDILNGDEPCCRRVTLHKDWNSQTMCDNIHCLGYLKHAELPTDEEDEDYYVAWECGRVVMGDGSLEHEFKDHPYERYVESVYLCEKCKDAWMLKNGYWNIQLHEAILEQED